ncbi:MAG: hypothetical protein P9L94_19780 [Candidatus Hinthialibacter antarcticus]|nr:hypothetical protein [Candidatus Hinthialibacter antarcticus]
MFMKQWLMTDPIETDLIGNATEQVGNVPRDRNRRAMKAFDFDFLIGNATEQVGNVPRDRNRRAMKAFDFDFLQENGGESQIRPTAGMSVSGAGASSEWRLQETKSDRINFDDLFGRQEYVIVYAFAKVLVDEATTTYLGVGSDDQCKLWVNGEMVYSHRDGRQNSVDDDYVSVDLIEGENTLLLKVMNQEIEWGMTCRFLDKSDISEFDLIEAQLESLPQESFNELALIVGGVALTTVVLLVLLLFLAKSSSRF